MSQPLRVDCEFCLNQATCYGRYDGQSGFHCDECCGHGCEDGRCIPVSNPLEIIRWLDKLVTAREQDIEDLRAEAAAQKSTAEGAL